MRNSVGRLYFLHFAIVLTSCAGTKGSGAKNNSMSLYESFFINDSTMQYFIGGLKFKEEAKISVDFTLRVVNDRPKPVVMNFTILSEVPLEQTKLQMRVSDQQWSVFDMSIMYREKQKKLYKYRYSSLVEFEKINLFFKAKERSFVLNEKVLTPKKKVVKQMELLGKDLFGFVLNQ
mgnify:CR=1 FL=1|jgi:hypothetical protein